MTSRPISRIGIDARLLFYREGGIAEYTRRLIEALQPLDHKNDYRLLVHGSKELSGPDTRNFHSMRTFTPCHHRYERPALALEVARLRLDLLHSPDFIPPLFGARRTIITVHDLNFLHYPQFQTPDSFRYYNGHIRAAVQKADHILADSQATKDDLCDLLDVAPEKITVHMLGVDPAFRPLPAEAISAVRREYALPNAYLLFVGTYEPRKNLPGLVEGYALLRARYPDVPPLVLVGRRGWLYESVFETIKSLNLQDRIIFIEDAPFADLPALYNGASLLTLPSFYEGFGLPPLEAMACGVPTVCADRSSLPEVVGSAAILIDPEQPESIADGLYSALTDSALRRRLIADGLARAAGFTWERTARVALEVYRRILD